MVSLGYFFTLPIQLIQIIAMNQGKKFSFLLLVFIHFCTTAQDYSITASDLQANLLNNANAVIRDYSWEIIIEDVKKLRTKRRSVVTILNKVGYENFVNTAAGYDNDSKIKSISAKFYDAAGKQLKKYSKGKFTDVSAVSNGTLYDDSRVLYVEYTPVSYPFTMVFEVEKEWKSTGYIPNWNPIRSYYLGIEKSSYKITNLTRSEIRFKEKNFENFDVTKTEFENGFEYVISNVEPFKYESYSVGLESITPQLLVALNQFTSYGVIGTVKDWDEFGTWMHTKILEGKTELPQSTKDKILQLTADAKTDVEKAKIVYQFVQDKTRYISVQVGIGGIQPIAANQVDNVGYGDCKGLTNYTKALLDVVGVKSNYVHVQAGRYDGYSFEKDFASLEQGNHVILNIPNDGDDIWLECTSQTSPFGFLGGFTDDRDVLVVTPEGGVIKRTPSYLNEDNLQVTEAEITLDPKGNVNATVTIDTEGIQYDNRYYLKDQSVSDLKKHYKSDYWSYNNNLEINSVNVKNDMDSITMKESLDVSISEYAAINGNDYLIKVNMFNRFNSVPKRYRNRKLPFKISRGFKDVDSYTFKVPEGFELTFLPPEKLIETKFGTYKVHFERVDDTTFIYHKNFILKAGEHPKEDYASYRKFLRSVAKYENLRISLTKKT